MNEKMHQLNYRVLIHIIFLIANLEVFDLLEINQKFYQWNHINCFFGILIIEQKNFLTFDCTESVNSKWNAGWNHINLFVLKLYLGRSKKQLDSNSQRSVVIIRNTQTTCCNCFLYRRFAKQVILKTDVSLSKTMLKIFRWYSSTLIRGQTFINYSLKDETVLTSKLQVQRVY